MDLKKIESALEVLGWNGEITNISISSEGDLCNVKFSISKESVTKIESKEYRITDTPQVIQTKRDVPSFEEYCNSINEKGAEGVTVDISGNLNPIVKSNSNSISSPKPRWKTPKPRPVLRYVFFQSQKAAKDFANEYIQDFELIEAQTKTGSIPANPYEIKKNTINNQLYSKGFVWVLEFRMNGREFETLEACEDLKKLDNNTRGGACMRYKEPEKLYLDRNGLEKKFGDPEKYVPATERR